MRSAAQPQAAVVKPVRDLFDDCFCVGSVQGTPAGWRAYTARGLGLGTFDTEGEAEAAVYSASGARRAAH